MDARTQARAFEPFFTRHPDGTGTGLGLATVQGIVQQLGGTVSLESSPGEGTTVHVQLLAEPAPLHAGTPVAAKRHEVSGKQRTVLLVEDNAAVRATVRRMLNTLEFHVVDVEDGSAALAMIQAPSTPIDLLISDVIMPGMRGSELVRRARAVRAGLRVLLVSGHIDDPDALADADAMLLQKPFTQAELAIAIGHVLV